MPRTSELDERDPGLDAEPARRASGVVDPALRPLPTSPALETVQSGAASKSLVPLDVALADTDEDRTAMEVGRLDLDACQGAVDPETMGIGAPRIGRRVPARGSRDGRRRSRGMRQDVAVDELRAAGVADQEDLADTEAELRGAVVDQRLESEIGSWSSPPTAEALVVTPHARVEDGGQYREPVAICEGVEQPDLFFCVDRDAVNADDERDGLSCRWS